QAREQRLRVISLRLQHRNLITTLKDFNPNQNNSNGTKQQSPKQTEGRSFAKNYKSPIDS
ncbi:MAG: hypothetical protein ABIN67_12960, partial [Ferruginibacter sp.]